MINFDQKSFDQFFSDQAAFDMNNGNFETSNMIKSFSEQLVNFAFFTLLLKISLKSYTSIFPNIIPDQFLKLNS